MSRAMDALEQAARAIYTTLAAAGHGPRPWAAHSPHNPVQSWEHLPPKWRVEYLAAAKAALQPELHRPVEG